jgi:glutamine synthetase
MANDVATAKETALAKAKEFVEKNNIDTIRVGAVDLDGIWRGKQFGAGYFLSAVAKNGTNIADVLFGWDVADEVVEGLSYTSWETGFPDIKLVPDLSTLRLMPWEPRSASAICDMKTLSGEPLVLSPRDLLRSATDKAAAMGFVPKAAYEFELYLFDGPIDQIAESHWRNIKPLRRSGYCYSMLHQAGSNDVLGQVRNFVREAGVDIEATISEHGPGQYEINLKYSDALSAADNAIFVKYAIKDIAAKNGCTATFMAKPNAAWAGSSGHIHMSLSSKSGEPLFANPRNSGMLSDLGLSFVAGLKELSRDLSAIYLPNVNSYKRTNGRSWAAANSSWGIDNRTVSCRAIPSAGPSARVENRIPGADTNPYLGIAACLLSGLYGIENKLAAGPPFVGNAYRATADQARPLASSLEEAMGLFGSSAVVSELFPKEFIEHYVHMKKWELMRTNYHITDWELARYLEII